MNSMSSRHTLAMFGLLAALMAATRSHHFATALHMPDASVAVFFLAAFYLGRTVYLPLLLLEAGFIDYIAITYAGVSDWCVTPAYGFLVPTYAAMWLGGRWYAGRHGNGWPSLVPLAASAFVSASIAFLISNGSFYLLSGRYTDVSWVEYTARVGLYYGSYVSNALLYVALAAVLHAVYVTILPARTSERA